MSFNYTPPPEAVLAMGRDLTYAAYASALFVPHVKAGAILAGAASGAISFWVTSYAKGDMGGLSHLIEPPIQAAMGALVGAALSFVSKSVCQWLMKIRRPRSAIAASEEQAQESDSP